MHLQIFCTVWHQLGGPHGWLVSYLLDHKSEASAGPGSVGPLAQGLSKGPSSPSPCPASKITQPYQRKT